MLINSCQTNFCHLCLQNFIIMNRRTFFLILFGIILISRFSVAQQWQSVNSQTNFILYGMHFPPGQNDVGYAVGMQYTYDAPGVIVKTSNGGLNWSQIYPDMGEIDGLEAVCFITPDKGFAAGWNNYFIKTTNGGESWVPISVGSDVWYYVDIEFWDENNGVATGVMNSGGSKVFITNNGGFSWTVGGTLPYSVLDICYANESTLYAVGTGNIISKSENGGQSFSNIYQSTGITMGVDFANTNFGVVGGEDGKILSTNDGGASWSSYSTGYHSFYAVHVFDKDSAYVGGTDVDIYKTTNAGASWTLDYNGPGASSMYNFSFTDNNTGFCSGSQGTMLRRNAPIATNFIADKTEVCAGNQVQFTDLSVGANSWEWTFEGGEPETSNEQNPIITYYYAGNYDVTLVASNEEQSQSHSVGDYIQVLDQPQPQIAGITNPCVNTIEIYTTPMHPGSSYAWEVSGGSIESGQGTSSISVHWSTEAVELAYVIVNEIVGSDCSGSDTLEVSVEICEGIQQNDLLLCQISPNPVKNILKVTFPSKVEKEFTYSIISNDGKRVLNDRIVKLNDNNTIEVDVSNLIPGIYILSMNNSDSEILRTRFLKAE